MRWARLVPIAVPVALACGVSTTAGQAAQPASPFLVSRGGCLYATAQNDNRFGIIEVLDRKLRDLAERR